MVLFLELLLVVSVGRVMNVSRVKMRNSFLFMRRDFLMF